MLGLGVSPITRAVTGVGVGNPARTLLVWGDSTAAQAGMNSTASQRSYLGNNWVQAGLHIAGHPLTVTRVSGRSGMRTDQIIPYFSEDVAPYGARYVLISVGTNNIVQGYSAAATIADLQTMVSLCQSVGAVPVVTTVSCGESISGNATWRATWLDYNAQVRALAIAEGIPCIDLEQVYVDPATIGTTYAPLAGYTDGSVHPANKGSIRWGQKLAEWLATLPGQNLKTAATAFGNPLFTGTAGTLNGATGQAPTGGTVSKGAGTTVASSIVARTDGQDGAWWQVAASGSGTADYLSLILGTVSGISVGDTVRALADVEVDTGHANALYMSLRLRFNGATLQWSDAFVPATALGGMVDPYPKMRFRIPEIAVPPGTTSVSPYLSFSPTTNAPWSITARVGGVYVAKV